MSRREKLIKQITAGKSISYSEAEKILIELGFKLTIRGSHHIFRKDGYPLNVTLKMRYKLYSKNFLQMEVRLWFLLTTTILGITALVKNSDGVKINMVFHGNLIFQNKFEL